LSAFVFALAFNERFCKLTVFLYSMTTSNRLLLIPAALFAASVFPSCKPAPAPTESTPPPAPSVAPSAAPAASVAPAPAASVAPAETAPVEQTADTKKSVEIKDPVAIVNGEPIAKAQLDEAFKAAVEASGVKADDLSAEQKLNGYRQILDELIMDKLVAKAAADITVTDEEVAAEIAKLKKQFPSEETFQAQLKEAGQTPEKLAASLRTMLQQQRWMQSQVKETAALEEDAKKFYDSNTEEFKNPEQVKASHILFMVNKDDSEEVVKQKEAAAKKAAARAKKEDFTKLAKELSEEPGAKQSGGDLGFFSKDKMVPEFADAAFSQKTGEVGAPVRTQFGWHVIKVTDKKPAGTVPFEEVKEQILAYLKSMKQREAVQGVLKNLRDSAKIETSLPAAGN
jgi:peptidyl-prolyl cis-trans isomerase C